MTQTHAAGLTAFDIWRLLDGKWNPLILELGSSDGKDTERFLTMFPGGRVVCFEADPRGIGKWQQRIRSPRAELIEMAVSDRDDAEGVTPFHLSSGRAPERFLPPGEPHPGDDWDMSSSLLAPKGHLKISPWVTFPKDILVRTITLDTWLASRPEVARIDFMWVDVQGAHGLAIAGGQKTLRLTRYFYTEFSDRETYATEPKLEEICRMLPDGFEFLGVWGGENALFGNNRPC